MKIEIRELIDCGGDYYNQGQDLTMEYFPQGESASFDGVEMVLNDLGYSLLQDGEFKGWGFVFMSIRDDGEREYITARLLA